MTLSFGSSEVLPVTRGSEEGRVRADRSGRNRPALVAAHASGGSAAGPGNFFLLGGDGVFNIMENL